MKKPCNQCPFLKSTLKGWLGKKRTTELVKESIHADSVFHCHKTLAHDGEDTIITSKTLACAGAALLAKKEGGHNAYYRWYVREMQGAELVFDSAKDFINHHS